MKKPTHAVGEPSDRSRELLRCVQYGEVPVHGHNAKLRSALLDAS
jgi:hypothetical protein